MAQARYAKLADFGRELLSKKSLEEGLPLIGRYAKEVIGTQRCSIFIYDKHNQTLWTTLADGTQKITVESDKGIVGQTLKEKKPLVVNDAYAHPSFLVDVDKETGYTTRNIITAPVFSANRELLGVIELLNKDGDFTAEDEKFIVFFSHYISGFIELVKTYIKTQE
jgi:GAF domain-containing protein